MHPVHLFLLFLPLNFEEMSLQNSYASSHNAVSNWNIVSWHIKHMVLAGGGMNANVSVHFSLNCQFSLSTFLLAVNLLLQPAKCQHATCSKNESARSSEWPSNMLSVYRWHWDKSWYTRADPTKTHGEGITVRGTTNRQLAGQVWSGGRLYRTAAME